MCVEYVGMCADAPQSPGKDDGSPGDGVTDGWELPDTGAGNQT